jgi:hypothetical protein
MTAQSENSFLEAVALARANRWCTSPSCTTCGAHEFRRALLKGGRHKLAEALATVDLEKVQRRLDWRDSLRLALDHLDSAELKDQVLTAWYPQLREQISIADFVLFYYVRRGALFAPMSVELLKQWRDRCVELACESRDESLLESLIYVLGSAYHQNPALAAVVESKAATSLKVRKAALRNRGDEPGARVS